MNNNLLKNLAVWLLIGFLVFLIIDFYKTNNTVQQSRVVSYSNFLSDVKNGNVSKVEIRGNNITGEYSNGTLFSTYSPNDPSLIDKLEKKLGIIVLSSNQALIWETLENINRNNSIKGYGSLFS